MLTVSRPDIETDYIVDFPVSDRFIKIPIDRYLSKLTDLQNNPITAIAPQVALINAINDPQYRAVVAALSRRTGKTFIANVIAQLITFMPNANVLIISPNYALSQISWDLQRSLFKRFDIKLIRSNAKDKVMELENGSTIRMGSVSQADSVVGRSYDLILFDEAALDDRGIDVYNIQLRPTLDKLNSKVVFISTPRGNNYFHDLYKRGFSDDFPEWVSIHSDYKENPRVSLKDIDQARKSMSIAEFDQEYMADFIALQGRIFNFNPANIIDGIDVSTIDIFDTIGGLDIGFKDDTAFCVGITDGVNWYIVDEYKKSQQTTASHARAIRTIMDKWSIDFVYIDSAAAQTKFDFAMNFDISCVKANKSVLDGIGYLSSLVEQDRLFVDKSCTHVLETLDSYVWDDREGLLKERPKNNGAQHMADAMRYAFYSHSYNMEPV